MLGFQGGSLDLHHLTRSAKSQHRPESFCGTNMRARDEPVPEKPSSIGLAMFPKSGHVLNPENRALFQRKCRTLHRAGEADTLPGGDPRSIGGWGSAGHFGRA